MTGGNRKGFSAVEMLIVVAIFAVCSVVITATYINFMRLHRRVANAELLGEEVRFVAEALVRAARSYTVNYPALPDGVTSPSSELELVSSAGTPLSFARFATSTEECAWMEVPCLALSNNGGITWSPITGTNVSVNEFKVFITPTSTPFEPVGIGVYNNNNQPRVTFLLDLTYRANNPLEAANIRLQTSVSSRVYLR